MSSKPNVLILWPHRINPSNEPKEFQVWAAKNRNRAINENMVECKFEPSRQRITEATLSVPAYSQSSLAEFD